MAGYQRLSHPFTPGTRGVCIYPEKTTDVRFKPCGKMKVLHAPSPDMDKQSKV